MTHSGSFNSVAFVLVCNIFIMFESVKRRLCRAGEFKPGRTESIFFELK